MSRGIVPQYIKRTGPARHINKQTKIQTDIPVIQEILAEKIKSRLESKNVNCQVEAVDYKSIMSELPGADIYVYIAKPDDEVLSEAERLNIAVFPGVPFLTGMGADDVFDKICEAIAK